jgi:hypothetical protein
MELESERARDRRGGKRERRKMEEEEDGWMVDQAVY